MKTATSPATFTQTNHNTVVLGLSVLVGLAALLFRVGILPAHAEFDELYHLLAARSWIDSGTLAIADGEYLRGSYFTKAIGWVMMVLGAQDLGTARVLSVVIGTAIPVLVFLGVNRVAGLAVAVIVAVLTILWPQGILESQSVRFYGAQVLTFLIGAAALYFMTEKTTGNRVLWGIVMIAAWTAAIHFQITSAVGIAGAVAGIFCIVTIERLPTWRGRIVVFGSALVLGLVVLAIAAQTGLIEKAWAFYRWTPGHAEGLRDYVGFYHKQYEIRYGMLWYTTPLWAVIALYARPRLVFFCLSIFVMCFVVHSFSGMKSLRYLSYASPLLFVVWATAFVWIWDALAQKLNPMAASAIAVVVAGGFILTSDFVSRSVSFAMGEGYSHRDDWTMASEAVGDWGDAPFIATSRELHMLEYVSDYDLAVSRSRVTELVPPVDFTDDFRTGRPVVGAPESITAVLKCEHDGLFVATTGWWEREKDGGVQFAALLDAEGYDVETRTAGDVIAVRWTDPNAGAADCSAVPISF